MIETDGEYRRRGNWRGAKSTGFRLSEEYRNAPFESRILTHLDLARQVAKLRAEKAAGLTDPLHKRLREHVLTRASVAPPATVENLPMQCLKDGQIFFSASPHGRVYHGYANLPRGLRKYVRLDGEACHAVDIKNSQPTLLGLVLRGGFSANRTGRQGGGTGREKKRVDVPLSYDRCLNDYVRACVEGTLYERLVVAANDIAAGRPRQTRYDREGVKRMFFAVAYGPPNYMLSSAVGEAFERLWPGVFEAVRDWKRRAAEGMGRDEQRQRRPWAAPSLAMQRVESDLVLRGAAARFLRENPKAPLLTVHDSLITTAHYVGAAREAVVGEFRRRFGLPLQTTVGPWYAGEPDHAD